MKFDLTTLSLFLAAYEESSLAKAANREHISLSALSKRISDMEHALDAELFIRSHSGIEPTPLAESMAPRIRRLLSELQQLEELAKEGGSKASGYISIITTMAATRQYLPMELARFSQRYPGIRVELREEVSRNVATAVQSSSADIGFLFEGAELEGLEYLPYRSDTLAVLVPANHTLADQPRVKFRDLLQYELIAPIRGSMLESLVLSAFKQYEAEYRPKMRVASFDSLCQMVHENLGIALVPEHYLSYQPNETSGLKVVALDEPWATRRICMCVKNISQLPPAARMLLDHLVRQSPPPAVADASSGPRVRADQAG